MKLTVKLQISRLPGKISLSLLSGPKLSVQSSRDRGWGEEDDATELMLKIELGYRKGGLVFYCFPAALGSDLTALNNHDGVGSRKELRYKAHYKSASM